MFLGEYNWYTSCIPDELRTFSFNDTRDTRVQLSHFARAAAQRRPRCNRATLVWAHICTHQHAQIHIAGERAGHVARGVGKQQPHAAHQAGDEFVRDRHH